MKVTLKSYTMPSEELMLEGLTSVEDLVAYCARVSNPANQINKETSAKLIKYLVKHQHWSPLEMADATIEIQTTRDIGRQVLRHRSFVFQEFSQRYADPTGMGFEISEARLQDTKNRQNSIEVDDKILSQAWVKMQELHIEASKVIYTWAIENGIAKEQARKILPEGLTTTTMYMKGSIRSWIHYISLRSGNGTQKEHREIAVACATEIASIFPLMKEFVDAD
jgi:thymidylate synthase (FAD)